MSSKDTAFNWLRGMLGASIGGTLGYFAFFWIARQGLYALILPGTLLGWGCGYLSGIRSTTLGVICGVLALTLGVCVEWQFAPFITDNSFAYFVTHLQKLKPMTLIMIVIGGYLGFRLGTGRDHAVAMN